MQTIITKNAQQIANNSIVGIEDANLRKRLYIYSLAVESLAEFFENAGYFTTTKDSLYKNCIFSQNIDIADFRLDNARIDVRIMDNLSPTIIIPKKHKELGIEPDFYFVIKIDENLKNIFIEGFIPTESLTFDKKIQDFYVVNSSKLIKFDRLKQVLKFTKPKSYSTHFEEEELFRLYLKLQEKALAIEGQRLLFQGLLTTPSFIKKINTSQKIDNMAKNIKLMPTLLEEIIPQLTEKLTTKQEIKEEISPKPPIQEEITTKDTIIEEENVFEEIQEEYHDKQEELYQYQLPDENIPPEEIEIYEDPYNIKQNEIDKALAGLTTTPQGEDAFFEDDYIPRIENVQEFEPQVTSMPKKTVAKPLFLHLLVIFLLGLIFFSFGIFKKPTKIQGNSPKDNYNAVMPSPVEISGISWGITEDLSKNEAFIDYLNQIGKTIESELTEGLQTVSKLPKEKDMQISIIFDDAGIFKNIIIKKTSGSKEVDKKACAIIKEALEALPPENLEMNARFVRSILLITFKEK